MPTITKSIRAPKIVAPTLSSFTHSEDWKSEFANRLGINDNTARADAIERLHAVLTDAFVKIRQAENGPLRAHQIAALSKVREDAARLHKTIVKLDQPYRSNLPDADVFVEQLEKFHDQLAIYLTQMNGRKKARGGARKVEQANAKETALHALRAFFGLNARDITGKLRSSSLEGSDKATWDSFSSDCDDFVYWVVDTTGLLPRKAKKKAAVRKAAPRKKQRA